MALSLRLALQVRGAGVSTLQFDYNDVALNAVPERSAEEQRPHCPGKARERVVDCARASYVVS